MRAPPRNNIKKTNLHIFKTTDLAKYKTEQIKQQDMICLFRYTLKSASGRGIEVQVLTLGCTITSIKVPDRNGHIDDVVLGFDDLAGKQ